MEKSYMWEICLSILVAVLGSNGLWAFLQCLFKKKSAQSRILLGLAHDKIMSLCDHYIERGGVTSSELHDLLKYHYEPYSDEGGNGTAEVAINKVKALPFISDDERIKRDETLKDRLPHYWVK